MERTAAKVCFQSGLFISLRFSWREGGSLLPLLFVIFGSLRGRRTPTARVREILREGGCKKQKMALDEGGWVGDDTTNLEGLSSQENNNSNNKHDIFCNPR